MLYSGRLAAFLAGVLFSCSPSGAGVQDAGRGSDLVQVEDRATDSPPLDSQPSDVDVVGVVGIPEYRMVDLVDPFIAVGGMGFRVSNNFPGASAPFGMVQPSPDTCTESGGGFPQYHCGGYHTEDEHVCGFSNNHLSGVGAPDLGLVSFMPSLGSVDLKKTEVTGYLSGFERSTEEAHPGYYSVVLSGSEIQVELTATRRVAHHRYSYPEGAEDALVVFDLDHTIQGGTVLDAALSIDEGEASLSGSVFNINRFADGITVYYYARFDTAWSAASPWEDGQWAEDAVAVEGAEAGCVFSFPPGSRVEVQVGLSYVSVENARENLEIETPDWDFDGVRSKTEAAWEELLSRVRFSGGTERERVIMATALYHAFLMPNLFQDVNNEYRGFDLEVHATDAFEYHTNFSMWDTYRTVHPLYILVAPEKQLDMVRSLVDMAAKGGYFPRWPMGYGYDNGTVGTPADIIIAESYLKGITDFDAEGALLAMLATADGPVPPEHLFNGREGIESYLELGYVATNAASRNVSRSLEFYIADFAIAGLSQALGDAETAQRLRARSKNYTTLWDPENLCFRGRTEDGEFEEPFNPMTWEAKDYYYGGSCLHYAWLVPHDMLGYLALYDSTDAFTQSLEEFMELGREEAESDNILYELAPTPHYTHGNQPDIHAPYLFLLSGRPDLTQKWVSWISDFHYTDDRDGLPGNDDGGTLSSWYVFSSLGLYPVPGADYYMIGRPLFPLAEIDMGDHLLTVEATDAGGANIYVQAVTLDGLPMKDPVIRHADLMGASVLHFDMGPSPSAWGSGGLPDWIAVPEPGA